MAIEVLTKLVSERAEADQVYRLTCLLDNLHAVQGRNDGETAVSHESINETKDTTHTEGIASGEKATPKRRQRGRKQTTTRTVQTYQFERNSDGKTLLLELGGPYGLMAKALRDAVVCVNKAKYWLPSLALIGFMPTKPEHGTYLAVRAKTTLSARPGVIVSVGAKTVPLRDARMEPRNKPGGDRVMVPIFHERLAEPVSIEADMTINAECPRTAEEVAGLLHAMQGVPFGPARRGHIKIVKVERVQ